MRKREYLRNKKKLTRYVNVWKQFYKMSKSLHEECEAGLYLNWINVDRDCIKTLNKSYYSNK
jgi:hypothetical protein